jgi:hypothetical protein
VGDINGDGAGDLMAGARSVVDETRTAAGAVYLLFGGPDRRRP